jgi:hypothetical protein
MAIRQFHVLMIASPTRLASIFQNQPTLEGIMITAQ